MVEVVRSGGRVGGAVTTGEVRAKLATAVSRQAQVGENVQGAAGLVWVKPRWAEPGRGVRPHRGPSAD